MKKSYFYIGMIMGGFLISLMFSRHVLAAWPLNTPDEQSNPMWVGQNLVWNDSRLGSLDIFIMYPDQTVEPLVVMDGDQKLIATDKNKIYFEQIIEDTTKVYSLDLDSKVLVDVTGKPLLDTSPPYISKEDGSCEYASQENGDILITKVDAPWLNIATPLGGYNTSDFTGESSGVMVHLIAKSPKVTLEKDALVSDGKWSISNLIPASADGGEYKISGYAISQCNKGPESLFGLVTIDHTPPVLVSQIEVTPNVDTAKIHWRTDDKTQTEAAITDNQNQADEHTNHRFTYSHTLTSCGLDPDTDYKVDIKATNEANLISNFSTNFHTKSLADPTITLNSSSNLSPNQAGIWQGILLAEPGIVDDKIALIRLDSVWPVEWTIGQPPNLKRGSQVRFKGKVNHDGTKILVHGSKSMITIDGGSDLEVSLINSLHQASDNLYKWVSFTGKITHATKTKWQIGLSDGELNVVWNNQPQGKWGKDQTVAVSGILIDDGEGNIQLAGTETDLLAEKPQEQTVAKLVKSVEEEIVPPAEAAAPPLPAAKILEEQTSTITGDNNHNLWYSLALIGLSLIVYRLFFYSSRRRLK